MSRQNHNTKTIAKRRKKTAWLIAFVSMVIKSSRRLHRSSPQLYGQIYYLVTAVTHRRCQVWTLWRPARGILRPAGASPSLGCFTLSSPTIDGALSLQSIYTAVGARRSRCTWSTVGAFHPRSSRSSAGAQCALSTFSSAGTSRAHQAMSSTGAQTPLSTIPSAGIIRAHLTMSSAGALLPRVMVHMYVYIFWSVGYQLFIEFIVSWAHLSVSLSQWCSQSLGGSQRSDMNTSFLLYYCSKISPEHKGTRLLRTCYSAVCARDEEQGYFRPVPALPVTERRGTNENQFRNLVIWLEDQKIRHYKIEDRQSLRDIKSADWPKAFERYRNDLACPVQGDKDSEHLEWLLSFAVRLEYSDNGK
uniref:RNA transcription, translation and transport factor protein n=1 Tax=Timema shepardi TaxID=629360 RepID=A0A7R9AV68_TIMSH|nr:unnamed protein product [Timema shepardi]